MNEVFLKGYSVWRISPTFADLGNPLNRGDVVVRLYGNALLTDEGIVLPEGDLLDDGEYLGPESLERSRRLEALRVACSMAANAGEALNQYAETLKRPTREAGFYAVNRATGVAVLHWNDTTSLWSYTDVQAGVLYASHVAPVQQFHDDDISPRFEMTLGGREDG